MIAVKVAVAAMGVALTVARHPLVRVGVRTAIANPKLREAAIETARVGAYNAGRVARRIVPRSLIG